MKKIEKKNYVVKISQKRKEKSFLKEKNNYAHEPV